MKNAILKTITAINAVVFIAAMCFADSDSYVPFIVMGICSVWLLPFAIANSEEYWEWDRKRHSKTRSRDL